MFSNIGEYKGIRRSNGVVRPAQLHPILHPSIMLCLATKYYIHKQYKGIIYIITEIKRWLLGTKLVS